MGREHQVLAQVRHAGLVDVVTGLHMLGGHADGAQFGKLAGDEESAAHARSTLVDLGVVVAEQSLGGEQQMTVLGRKVAAAIQESRGTNGPDRHEAVARGLLTWISSSPHGRSQSSDFLEDPAATAFGVPFTEHEIEQAEEYLVDNDLITGTGSSGGLVLVEATSRGRQFLRDLRPFDEQLTGVPMMSSSTTNVTVGGDMKGSAVAIGGHHTRQHASQTTITVTTEQRKAVVDELQQILDGLPADAPQVAREAVSTALAETTDPQTTRTIDDIKTAVTQASATLATNMTIPWIFEHGPALMQQLAAVASLLG